MKVISVIVSYQPHIDKILDCFKSLYFQCADIVLVDNGSRDISDLNIDGFSNLQMLNFENNMGIGFAQNTGIAHAISSGADFILLSDQDTVYPSNYEQEMVACYEKVSKTGKVAAVCPNFYDVNRSELCPMIVDAGPLGFKLKTATAGLHKVCFANASGMIIPAQVFSDVGLMREDLFIDCVDTEWCTRAEHLGYSIYCNADMVITHSLGDRSINVLGRVITQHSPLRHYYLARNSMYLALYSKHLTLNKRLFFLLRAIKRVVGHAVLSAPRLENLRMGVLGLWHGIIGRLGKHG